MFWWGQRSHCLHNPDILFIKTYMNDPFFYYKRSTQNHEVITIQHVVVISDLNISRLIFFCSGISLRSISISVAFSSSFLISNLIYTWYIVYVSYWGMFINYLFCMYNTTLWVPSKKSTIYICYCWAMCFLLSNASQTIYMWIQMIYMWMYRRSNLVSLYTSCFLVA